MRNDPFARFQRWFKQAQDAGIPLAEAMALATSAPGGRPSVRFVLLKQCDQRGFVFFTDGRSRKGGELQRNPRAAVAFYWNALGKQVRVEGRIAPVTAEEADAYWQTRPRESRLAASVSRQSTALARRADLLRRWKELARRYRGKDIPRPPAWTGFRIVPDRIEFWIHGDHRLHQRELFTRAGTGWKRTLLQP